MKDFSESDLKRAREMAPKMDERSLGIFMASGLFDMMNSFGGMTPARPTHSRGSHGDVTGFYQRTRKK